MENEESLYTVLRNYGEGEESKNRRGRKRGNSCVLESYLVYCSPKNNNYRNGKNYYITMCTFGFASVCSASEC